MARRESSSQDIWTQAEALERAGRGKEAIDLYVQAAIAEEDARRPMRARLLWEQIAQRTGASGTVLERLARVSARAHLDDDAFDYWVAAVASFHAEGRTDEADRARGHALDVKRRLGDRTGTEHEVPALARDVIRAGEAHVRDLLGPVP